MLEPVPRRSNDPLPVCPDKSTTSSLSSSGSAFVMEERRLISQSELTDSIFKFIETKSRVVCIMVAEMQMKKLILE